MHVPLQSNLLMENLEDRKAYQFSGQENRGAPDYYSVRYKV